MTGFYPNVCNNTWFGAGKNVGTGTVTARSLDGTANAI